MEVSGLLNDYYAGLDTLLLSCQLSLHSCLNSSSSLDLESASFQLLCYLYFLTSDYQREIGVVSESFGYDALVELWLSSLVEVHWT